MQAKHQFLKVYNLPFDKVAHTQLLVIGQSILLKFLQSVEFVELAILKVISSTDELPQAPSVVDLILLNYYFKY